MKFLEFWRREADRFQAIVFDIDGTLLRGPHQLPGAAELLGEVRLQKKPLFFLTNDGDHTLEQKCSFLVRAGLTARPDEIINCLSGLESQAKKHDWVGRTFFAAGHAGADVELALAFHICCPANGVREMGVAAVDQNITVVEQRKKLLDHIVYGLSRFDHHKDFAGLFQIVHQFFKAVAADDVLTCGSAVDEFVHLFCRAVENRHSEALGLHIHDKVLAHDGKSD